MATLTIRNLDQAVKHALRRRAAERGVSMEQEARDLLAASLQVPAARKTSILADLRSLSITPKEPIDFKKLSDEM